MQAPVAEHYTNRFARKIPSFRKSIWGLGVKPTGASSFSQTYGRPSINSGQLYSVKCTRHEPTYLLDWQTRAYAARLVLYDQNSEQ